MLPGTNAEPPLVFIEMPGSVFSTTGQQPKDGTPMVTVTQSTTPRFITTQSGMALPTTITPQTDMNMLVTAICLYHHYNERKTSYDTLERCMEAMRDSSALVALYADAKGEIAARVLWPQTISLTKANDLTAYCYCTLRREFRSFRLDRMLACHPLTTPDDAEAA